MVHSHDEKKQDQVRYQGERPNVKEIYGRNKKCRGCSRYLLSVLVEMEKDGESLPAKLIFIRIYGKRWDIEVFFKACKSYLKLVKEYRRISYDAMSAHVAIAFARYMMLSVAQRENGDDKTICELCFCLLDEMEDITFSRFMCIIIDALMDTVMEYFHITEAQMEEFTAIFVQRPPVYAGCIGSVVTWSVAHRNKPDDIVFILLVLNNSGEFSVLP